MNEIKFIKENKYLPYPKMMQIEITTACPLRCPQCFVSEFSPRFMEFSEFKKIVDEASMIGVSSLVLFGGEPMLHRQIIEFMQYSINLGMHLYIYTSGWGFSERILDFFSEFNNNITILISLNGSNKEIHEKSRDNFELTFESIKKLKKSHIKYKINWVCRNDNVKDIEKLVLLAREYNADCINVVANKINSRGEIIEPIDLQNLSYLKKVLDMNRDIFSIENCNELLNNIFYKENKNFFSGCAAGIYNCSVTCDLYFVPCMHLMYKEKYQGIKEYWNNSSVLAKLRNARNKSKQECVGCRYNGRCNFCRALSIETYNDFNIGNSTCVLRGEERKDEI